MIKTKRAYATIVKELREQRVWSQEELAEISGVSSRTIQRIEAGESPSIESMKAIAAAFNLDVAEFKSDQRSPSEEGTRPDMRYLLRVTTGEQVFALSGNMEAFSYTTDDLRNEVERSKVGGFLDFVKECSELWGDLEPSQQIELCSECSEMIEELHSLGIWIFCGKSQSEYKTTGASVLLKTVVFGLHYANNQTIRKAESFEDLLTQLAEEQCPNESTAG